MKTIRTKNLSRRLRALTAMAWLLPLLAILLMIPGCNSRRPSGKYVCRGLENRPAVGPEAVPDATPYTFQPGDTVLPDCLVTAYYFRGDHSVTVLLNGAESSYEYEMDGEVVRIKSSTGDMLLTLRNDSTLLAGNPLPGTYLLQPGSGTSRIVSGVLPVSAAIAAVLAGIVIARRRRKRRLVKWDDDEEIRAEQVV